MRYSIIGSGKVGAALARHFASNSIAVGIANTRGPETIAAMGEHIVPMPMSEAAGADVIILAVPFAAHDDVGALLPDWSGKIVVDAMNSYGIAKAAFKGRSSTEVVADAFPGARIVKTFNQLTAPMLAEDPMQHGGRRLMFLASDDAPAEAAIARLVADLGYAPVALGKLDAAARLISYGGAGVAGPLVMQQFYQYV